MVKLLQTIRTALLVAGLFVTGLLAIGSTSAAAQPKNRSDIQRLADGKTLTPKRQPENPAGSSAVSVETVNRLVQTHVPELRAILAQLEKSDPQQYNAAIRDLSRSVQRLTVAKRRDADLYEIELLLWKSRTSANLSAARVKVRDTAANRKALQAAVVKLTQAETARAQYDVVLYKKRLAGAKAQLEAAETRLTNKQAESAETVYETFLRKAGRLKRSKNSTPDA